MTPADRLTRAADLLDRMADAATPGPWEADISTHTVKPIIGKTFARTVAFMPGLVDDDGVYGQFYNPEDASLIALTSDPVTVRLIAAWLRTVGAWEDEGLGRPPLGTNHHDAWHDSLGEALALADHINERTTP